MSLQLKFMYSFTWNSFSYFLQCLWKFWKFSIQKLHPISNELHKNSIGFGFDYIWKKLSENFECFYIFVFCCNNWMSFWEVNSHIRTLLLYNPETKKGLLEMKKHNELEKEKFQEVNCIEKKFEIEKNLLFTSLSSFLMKIYNLLNVQCFARFFYFILRFATQVINFMNLRQEKEKQRESLM